MAILKALVKRLPWLSPVAMAGRTYMELDRWDIKSISTTKKKKKKYSSLPCHPKVRNFWQV
jgi:hypothetical protein